MTTGTIAFPVKGKMHAGGLDSERVRRAYSALAKAQREGRALTTAQLDEASGGRNAHSDAAALRANGIPVLCRYVGRSESGAKIYEYELGVPANVGLATIEAGR